MRLKVTSFGQSAEGIALTGNPKSGEPDHVRITFPGGTVEVVRATDGKNPDYWVHVLVNHPKDGMDVPGEVRHGALKDARLDLHDTGTGSSAGKVGDFKNPNLYHLAMRIQPNWNEKVEE
jgi:hypothetical protein